MSKMPSTRPSEGLLLKAPAARMRGRMRWAVYDAKGRREQPVDPRGRLIRYSGEWMPNLITNHGLNRVPVSTVFGPSSGTLGSSSGWRQYLAVGTGSTEPDVSDATLDNEVQRSSTNATLSQISFELDTNDDVFRATLLRDVQVVMTADRNLSEYGLSDQSSTGVNIRELFRDGLGNPITISLLAGKTLRLQHELVIELPAPAAGVAGTFNINEFDAANNPVGSTEYNLVSGWTGTPAQVFSVWDPTRAAPSGSYSGPYPMRLTSNTYNRVTMVPGSGGLSGDPAAGVAYVGDSFQLVRRTTISAANSAYLGEWRGIGFYTGISGGFAACFSDPATFIKANTHTLRIGYVVTWGRG